MSLRTDGRIAVTGKKPHILSAPRPVNRDVTDAQDLIRTMHTNHTQSDPVAGEFATVEDAASAFGLTAEHTRKVESLISEVVADVRNMVAVAKSAREAGLPKEVVPEIIRRGVRLRERLRKSLDFVVKGKPLPTGSERQWGGRTYVKGSDGKWKMKGKGGGKSDGDKPKKDGDKPDKPEPKDEGGGKGKDGDKPEPKGDKGKGKDGDKPEGGKDEGGDGEESVEARFERIKKEAAEMGINVKGEIADHHDHAALDRLEARIKKKAAKLSQADQGGHEGEDGANPMDLPEGRPAGHDSPGQPHEIHRLQQEVHDLRAQLAYVKGRLDSEHQRGMHRQLEQEAQAVAKDPSPQALKWLGDRIKAFVTLVTGLASAATSGEPPKGGDKPPTPPSGDKPKGDKDKDGKPDSKGDKKGKGKPPPPPPKKGKGGRVDRRKEGYKQGEKDPGGWDDTKKSLGLFIDRRGRPVVLPNRLEKSGDWHPIPGGKRGGERRRKGSGWEYRYSSHSDKKPPPPPPKKKKPAVRRGSEADHDMVSRKASYVRAGDTISVTQKYTTKDGGGAREISGKVKSVKATMTGVQGTTPARTITFTNGKSVTVRVSEEVLVAPRRHRTRTTGGNHTRNEHGHKHDLKPGDVLTTRSRHGSDSVVVHHDGSFEHKGVVHRNQNSLLNAIHEVGSEDGPKRHGTTFGRYFGLTKQERVTRKAIRELGDLLKSRHVAVQMDRETDQVELFGNLEKAGIPAHMMPFPGAPRAVIDADAAVDLIAFLRGTDG